MAKTAQNIVVGAPSTIVLSAYGVAEGSGIDLGSTEGGLKVLFNPEFYFKKADQWLGKVGAVKTDEDMTIEVVLAEQSLANVNYAMGYPTTANDGTTFNMGGDSTVSERTLYINGNAPSGGTMKITVHKCVIIGATEIPMLKDDKTMLKLTFQVLQDTSQTDNQELMKTEYSGVDTTAPTVAMTTPAEDGTVTKDAKGTVTLTFTEAGTGMDQGSLIYGSADKATVMIMNITDTTATTLVAGTISYDATTKALVFTPTNNWTASDKHQIIITTGVRDIAGNYLESVFIGHFTVTA